MVSRMQRVICRTDSIVHFLGGLAINASADENLAWSSSETRARGILRELTIRSVQNLAWELQLYGKATFGGPGLADSFENKVVFTAAEGSQNDGAGAFRYHRVIDNGTLYDQTDVDQPQTPGTKKKAQVHLKLINRGVGAKAAGVPGGIEIEMIFETP